MTEDGMTEDERALRAIYHKMGGLDADIDWVDNCIREVALATLKDICFYLVLAHDIAEARHDDGEGEDYMFGAMYEIMQETERLIEQTDLLLRVAEE